jgi:RNA polymerase sigma-54 factor
VDPRHRYARDHGGPTAELLPRQAQTVTPAVVRSAHLLALPVASLEHCVAEMLCANPALATEPDDCPYCAQPLLASGCGCVVPVDTRSVGAGAPVDDLPGVAAGELAGAAAVLVDTGDRALVEYVLADLDGRGYLDRTPGVIAASVGVAEERVRAAIDAIRAVGPPGICAADLRECLLWQLDAMPDAPPLVRAVLETHLDTLARGRLGAVARALGVPAADVTAALEFLRQRMRPDAAVDPPAPPPAAVRPDLVFRAVPGDPDRFEVRLTASPRLRLDPDFARVAREARRLTTAEREMLRRTLAEAVSFVDMLAERGRTLYRIGVEVATAQAAFLRDGPRRLVPLTRVRVATRLGVHESTVSRAVSAKHVQLPDRRVVPLASLFGASGSVRECLRALVAAETAPLSDNDLVRALAEHGHPVSRSAVRKYRAQLGIPPQTLR